MSTRAIQYAGFGGPEVLAMNDVPTPEPGAGEVRVRVRAVGLNPVDAKTFAGLKPLRVAEALHDLRQPSRWFGRGPARFPRGVGRDFAGVVDAVGPGVTEFRLGAPVLGTLRSAPGDGATWGSLTEALVVPAAMVVPTPAGLDPLTAGSLGVAAETACGALRTLDVGAGDVLVISGASGGVGSLAAQLAVHRGATVVGIAGPASADYLRALGVAPVSYTGDVRAGILAATTGRPTAFLDCFGGYAPLARGLGIPGRSIGTLVPSPAALLRGARFTGSRHARPGDLRAVAALVADGAVSVRIDRVVPFDVDAVRRAYADLLAGRANGKVVVDVDRGTQQPR